MAEKIITVLLKGLRAVIKQALMTGVILILALAVYIELDSYRIISDADSIKYRAYRPIQSDTLSFDELAEKNRDVIGWIMIDDTKIDYPVVQGRSNDEYINKDVFGEFSLSGAIFLDQRNSPDLSDALSVFYGHNMAGDMMFGELKNFRDRKFFDSHRSGTLFCGGNYYRLDIFACFTANGHDQRVYRIPLPESEIGKWKENVMSLSENSTDKTEESPNLLLLSTCASGATDDRTLLAAYILPNGTPFEKKTISVQA
ncbi:MAG: class B sortase [Ruminococcus sp.]|nr:class B sortase [Ruminococcus sp.]